WAHHLPWDERSETSRAVAGRYIQNSCFAAWSAFREVLRRLVAQFFTTILSAYTPPRESRPPVSPGYGCPR
ncbi:hypothetical protein SISSUDRAFT_1049802, partial [Sistotremastrum suecicum HHB10207 ss-3]